MDLALHFGVTPRKLRKQLSEREFFELSRYAAEKGLPGRRIELLLARIAMFLDAGLLGAQNKSLRDYLDFERPSEGDQIGDEMEDLFGDGGTVIRG